MYLFHISLHGLVRSQNIELGRDSDTGGQITYVINLLTGLSGHPEVSKVELATRGFRDAAYDAAYGQPQEKVTDKFTLLRFFDEAPEQYLPKETLWSHLPRLKEEIIHYLKSQPALPDVIHAHYADAGRVGAEIAEEFSLPFIFTGHSLGRTKRAAYLERGWTEAQLQKQFNISERIEAEEKALKLADIIIASTQQEVTQQYHSYRYFAAEKAEVLAPGYDPAIIKQTDAPMCAELASSIQRFLNYPERPPILTIARPDTKKNLSSLVEAYATHKHLRNYANLVIFAGQREDIHDESPEAQTVFEELFYLIDKYDLYGHVALPKQHLRKHVADIYGYAAQAKGVFANVALQEPFGLTLIEAAVNGVPVVATRNGGAADVVKVCHHGISVDPTSCNSIGNALYSLISDPDLWKQCSDNARKHADFFSWKHHISCYVDRIKRLRAPSFQQRQPRWLVVSDIDHTLTGDRNNMELLHSLLKEKGSDLFFAVATGRSFDQTLQALDEWNLPVPEAILSSVGSEIHYPGRFFLQDWQWSRSLHAGWDKPAIAALLSDCPELVLQPSEHQRSCKLSYYVKPEEARISYYTALLESSTLQANIIYSHNRYLDILPRKASKSQAMHYLRESLQIPPHRCIAIGDSGNDLDMLQASAYGIVVANHQPELIVLQHNPHVIFTVKPYVAGVVEGMRSILPRV